MNYNIFQKITSFLLIFLFFFSITFKIPLYKNIFNFGQTYAENGNQRYNLVSIFVEEKIYPQIKTELERYAKDISGVLERTKAVIIPVGEKSNAFAIASLNEKFYYEGYNKDSKLIGTILVGKVPLPVVNDGSANSRTIFPYVDFEDKGFIYNHKTNKYEKNSKLEGKLKAEIWHGIISPNSSYKTEVESLKDFFDKDHEFYTGKGIFRKEIGVINGKNGEDVSNEHEPYVFYYDGIRENQSVMYKKYKAYTRYLSHLEDLSYNRFTKKLADTLKDIYSDGGYTKEQKKTIEKLMGVDLNKGVGKIKTEQIPDIHTRRIIQKSIKRFAEIFNSKLFGDIEKNVHNAGRYNKTVVVKKNGKDINQARVNVDTIPEIITKLDEISRLTIKNANTDLEDHIDDLVRNKGISRYIPLFQRIYIAERKNMLGIPGACIGWENEDRKYYKNFMYGKLTKSIGEKDYLATKILKKDIFDKENGAKMCSIYRGSIPKLQLNKIKNWEDYTNFNIKNNFYFTKGGFVFGQLVEANRARDLSVKDFEQVEDIKDDIRYIFESNEKYITPVALKRGFRIDYSKLIGTSVNEVVEPDKKRIKSLVNLDLNILKKESKKCLKTLEKDDKIGLRGRFGMNSPLYIDSKKIVKDGIVLTGVDGKHTDLKRSIVPLYSINGSKNIYDIYAKTGGFYELTGDELKNKIKELTPSASHCLKNNFLTKRLQKNCVYKPYKKIPPLLEFELEHGENSKTCEDTFRLPIEGQPKKDWKCNTQNDLFDFEDNFTTLYKKIKEKEDFKPGERKIIYLGNGDKIYNGNGIKKPIVSVEDKKVANEYKEGGLCNNPEHPEFLNEYFFKKIYSDIKHKSPNYDELYKEITGRTAYSLPVDKDRYIDFMSAIGKNVKIKYPYLFRIKKFEIPKRYLDKQVLYTPNIETVEKKLDEVLDRKSAQINLLIKNNNPEQLQGLDLEIYNYLKIANYPEANINLKQYLKNKPGKILEIAGEKKNMSYYDMLVFSIFWNNQNNPSLKYKYVMKKYLSDQFGGNGFHYPLVGNKKMYEIAYLGEHGDASNMYIKLDPKLKARNPDFDKIIEKNNDLTNKLNNSNIGSNIKEEGNLNDKCSPPEGVPLYKWPSALKCWIEDMLPPKVKISRGTCGASFDEGICIVEDAAKKIMGSKYVEKNKICTKDQLQALKDSIKECNKDSNKNSINDCTEKYLNKVEVSSDKKKYILNSSGKLQAFLKTTLTTADFLKPFKDILVFDNTTDIQFKLLKVEVSKDETKTFSDSNKKTIFDINNADLSNKESLEKLREYINFYNGKIRAGKGKVISSFTTKNKELDFTFEAFAIMPELKDKERKFKIIKSDPLKIEVRAENIFSTNFLIRKNTNSSSDNNEKVIVDSGIDTVVASDKLNIFLSNSKKIKDDKKTIDNDFSVGNNYTNTNILKNNIDLISESKEKLVFDLSHFGLANKPLDLKFPLKLKIVDLLEKDLEKNIILEKEVNFNGYFEPITSIKKSGEYLLEITDSTGLKLKKEFNVKADIPVRMKVDLSTSIMETGGNITTHLLSLYDKYDNIASGELYDLDIGIIGNGVKFTDNKLKKKLNVFEGYKNFRLKSTNFEDTNTIQFILKNKNLGVDLKVEKELKTLSDLKINVKISGEKLVVGGKKYNYNIEIKKDGKILEGFNSRAYARFNEIYLHGLEKYVNIKNGKGKGTFETKTVAIKDKKAKIDIKVEGIKNNFIKNSTIYPEVPMKIDYKLSKDKLVVLNDGLDTPIDINTTFVYMELKDRYNNLVFEDKNLENKYEFKLSFLDLLDTDVHKFYASTKPKDDPNSDFRDLKGVIKVTAKSEPGIGKFLIEVTPKIDKNSFTIKSNMEGEEDVVVNGLSETAGQITSYFAWNKNNIKNTKYNSLYTTLLGADYGNISKQDYLAGTLVFEKNNRALAVTTLLNSPYKRNNIFNIKKDGAISFVNKNTNLGQNIKIKSIFDNNGFSIALFNESINSFIGQIYYYFEKTNLDLIACKGTGLNFITCDANKEKTSIILKSSQNKYEVVKDGKNLILREKDTKKSIVQFDENGKLTKEIGIDLEFSRLHTGEGIAFFIKLNGKTIGVVSFVLHKATIDYTRKENVVSNRGNDNKNLIGVYISSGYYKLERNFSGISNQNYDSVSIVYNDPFDDKYKLNHFSKLTDDTYESFNKNPGVGWKDGNKTLLSFAAGKNVGEATKDYQSFHLINIGDPVIYLKKIQKNLPKTKIKRQFDSTIGKLLLNDDDIVSYSVFDYNNDKIKDIVILKEDGHIKLLEGTKARERFINKGNIVYFGDVGAESKMVAGDFSGDGFGDLVLTNTNGELFFVDNIEKNFERKKDSLKTPGKVMQLLSFDMDNDGIDDVITFDRNGELNIFYGKKDVGNKTFTKKTVEKGLGLTLNKTEGSGVGAIYFDGLYQTKKGNDLVKDNLEKSRKQIGKNKINETINAFKNNDVKEGSRYIMQALKENKNNVQINDEMFNSIIFEEILYNIPGENNNNSSDKKWFDTMETSQDIKLEEEDKNLDEADKKEFGQYQKDILEGQQALKDLDKFVKEKNPGHNHYPKKIEKSKITTFIKSKYAVSQGIQIKKTFTDVNGGVLLPGDKVKAKIIIRNTSVDNKTKIAYLENLPELLKLDKESIKVNGKKVDFKPTNTSKYNFLIDSYNLASNSDLILEYETEVLEYKMGFIKVGKFEKGEVGDDEYGDIIFKNDENNCGQDYTIYRSVSKRKYKEGNKKAVCKAELPDALKGNKTDTDGNQIPDKYDKIINSALDDNEDSAFKNFSEEGLDNLVKDSDGDGIPDLEDSSPFSNDDKTKMLNNLDKFTLQAEKAVDDLEFMIQGFGCGFGGGSCISSPMNWAPFAPGTDPTLYGYPIGDGFTTFEGLPAFSLFTLGGLLTVTKTGIGPGHIPGSGNIKFTGPFKGGEKAFSAKAIIPVPPIGSFPNPVGAGGRFGYAPGPVRIFLTPTITGAIGTAICFGDNVGAGYLPTPGLSPIIPGGNCIVAAAPLFGCSDDGSDGNIEDIGSPDIQGDSYGVYNGNCNSSDKNKNSSNFLKKEDVQNYIKYKNAGSFAEVPEVLQNNLKEAFKHIATSGGANYGIPNEPIFKIGNNNSTSMFDLKIDVDPSALGSGNFRDVIKMQMSSIPSFPEFIMDWVKRQWEEIINYADFPTVTVILPDFSGLGLGEFEWSNILDDIGDAFNLGKEQEQERIKDIQENKIKPLQDKKEKLGCVNTDTAENYFNNAVSQVMDNDTKCLKLDEEIAKLKREQYLGTPRQFSSGIKSVYKFLGSVPIINIYSQKIFVDIPWIDKATLDGALFELTTTRKQWENEIKSALENRSLGYYCDKIYNKADHIQSCKEEARNKAIKLRVNSNRLLSSLDKNIEILKSYKKLPEQLQLLVRIKEKRLQQVLCNIEVWSKIIPNWLKLNGKRFKTWVELYVLMKAILKSWQVLPDLFMDYEAECKQCKNERGDSINFIMRLIDMLIPKLPIIKLPKMPDVNIDLHNIRAGINVALPEFEFNFIPITFPKLPELYLPERPNLNVNFDLPEIPTLTDLKLPNLDFIKDLPDLPSLPEIELPNLPPAPTLPKLFSSIDKFVDILKIITKAMCLLRQNPFIPEWRAGDQISFITERGGYLPTDFHTIQMPQFTVPFVDSINLTTYVNLEFSTDYVIDLIKNITDPINNVTNNIIDSAQYKFPGNLDYRGTGIKDIDVNVKIDKNGIDSDIYEGGRKINFNYQKSNIQKLENLIRNGQNFIKNSAKEKLTNNEFKKDFIKNVSKLEGEKSNEIKKIWAYVAKKNYSEVDKLNNKILKNNKEKFDTLKNIINTEIVENKKLKKQLKNWNKIRKLGKIKNNTYFIAKKSDEKIKFYNDKFKKYNKETLENIKNLTKPDKELLEIKQIKKELNKTFNSGINNFSKELKEKNKKIIKRKTKILAQNTNIKNKILLAAEGNRISTGDGAMTKCDTGYIYKGIYITEKEKSYRLFDYLDELNGKETITQIDFDNDKDDDLLYMMKKQIYLKENLEKKEKKDFLNADPIIYDDFKNYSKNIIEAINSFKESISENGAVNVEFTSPTNKNLTNFKLEFYPIIDKFDAKKAQIPGYVPKNTRKYTIASFMNIDDITNINKFNNFDNFNDWYISNKFDKKKAIIYKKGKIKHFGYKNRHLAYVDKFSSSDGITIKTKKFIKLKVGSKVSTQKKIYTNGNRTVRIKYNMYKSGSDTPEEGIISIGAHSSANFTKNDIEITSIVGGDIFIASEEDVEISGAEILGFVGLPILPDTTITFPEKNRYLPKDFIKIKYYNGREEDLHFSENKLFRIRDLGTRKQNYLVRLNIENDFYYSKIFAFSKEINGTKSKQLLISPQKWSDNYAPELNLNGNILIPVYQLQQTDITPYVYEDSGIENITKVVIDPKIEDTSNIKISLVDGKILLDLGKFDKIIKKKIKLLLTDDNNNTGEGEITLLIYPPVPEIKKVTKKLDKISGTINELLKDEPINIYRFRGGVLTKLLDKTGKEKVNTDEKGNFEFLVNGVIDDNSEKNKISVTRDIFVNGKIEKKEIANIDENTGKISLIEGATSIKVLASNNPNNDKAYVKTIISRNGEEIYYNYIIVSNTGKIKKVEDFNNIFIDGVYVQILDKTNYSNYIIPNSSNINPGTLVIHNINSNKKEALFSIFKDGRINILGGGVGNYTKYKIKYSENGKYPVFDLIIGDEIIAKVLLKTKGNYILR